MPVVVKTQSPVDLLALVPALVGFTPQQSVVLLPFRGKRTCGAIRFDLPSAGPPAVNKRFATFVVGTLCKLRGVDSVILVVVTNEAFGCSSAPPSGELAQTMLARLRQSGLRVQDALCQASDGWGSYLDAELPAGGRSLSEIADSDAPESVPPEVRRALAAPPPPSRVPDAVASEKRRVKTEFARYQRLVKQAEDTVDLPPELEPLEDLPELMERALEWDESEISKKCALLLFAWQGPPIRDMTMLQWATEIWVADLILDEAEAAGCKVPSAHPGADKLLGDLMIGVGPRPDLDRIDRGIKLLRAVVARADAAERVAPLCMLTWLSWAIGHGTEAGRYLDEAGSIRPDYGMVEVLNAMLSNGMMPEWAFAES
ncbi:MAG: hypothetical protein QOF79_2486 [Actinomycetota bacterium]|jgi:hypothetical protein|nr:hypothetical protein [Actinomycetota bacterium]